MLVRAQAAVAINHYLLWPGEVREVPAGVVAQVLAQRPGALVEISEAVKQRSSAAAEPEARTDTDAQGPTLTEASTETDVRTSVQPKPRLRRKAAGA